jgi:DNA-binding response OmpR family regulator
MRVLLVEDDKRLGAALADVLRSHGITVDLVGNAEDAVASLRADHDAVVLDLGLPDRDGFEVCSRIRRSSDVPILMATARADLSSRVHGLHLGADDYLVKPYDVRELMARIHAVTRRRRPATSTSAPAPAGAPQQRATGRRVRRGDVVIDVDRRVVEVAGSPVALTRKEFDLLALLSREPGVVFRREQILSEVWETRWRGGARTLEVHVASVRAKTGSTTIIETVRGVGYRLGE